MIFWIAVQAVCWATMALGSTCYSAQVTGGNGLANMTVFREQKKVCQRTFPTTKWTQDFDCDEPFHISSTYDYQHGKLWHIFVRPQSVADGLISNGDDQFEIILQMMGDRDCTEKDKGQAKECLKFWQGEVGDCSDQKRPDLTINSGSRSVPPLIAPPLIAMAFSLALTLVV